MHQIQKAPCKHRGLLNNGAPGRIRTSDRLIRSQVLYPAELLARGLLGLCSGFGADVQVFFCFLLCLGVFLAFLACVWGVGGL